MRVWTHWLVDSRESHVVSWIRVGVRVGVGNGQRAGRYRVGTISKTPLEPDIDNNNNAVIYTNLFTSYNKHRSKVLDKWRKSFATTIHCSIVCEASIICVVGVLPSLTALNATSGHGTGERCVLRFFPTSDLRKKLIALKTLIKPASQANCSKMKIRLERSTQTVPERSTTNAGFIRMNNIEHRQY